MSNQKTRMNFHTHSTHSDGLSSVSELVHTMHQNNVQWLALTDHDTLSGVRECIQLSNQLGIDCVTGVELSVSLDDRKNSIHLLAYDYDIDIFESLYDAFLQHKNRIIEQFMFHIKQEYNIHIKKRFNTYTYTDIACALVEAKYVDNVSEAQYLIRNHPNYRSSALTMETAIDMIHISNGLAIMAHPFDIFEYNKKIIITQEQIHTLGSQFVKLGMDGIEVFYADYSKEQVEFLEKIADELNLIKSVGTDYHNRPNRDIVYTDIKNKEHLLLDVLLKRKS